MPVGHEACGWSDTTSCAEALSTKPFGWRTDTGEPTWAEPESLVQTNSVAVAKQDQKRWSHRPCSI